jgi:hypothetical protein
VIARDVWFAATAIELSDVRGWKVDDDASTAGTREAIRPVRRGRATVGFARQGMNEGKGRMAN